MLLPLKENSVDRSRLRRSLLILAALLSLLPSILLGRFELDRIASAQRKQADQETWLAAKVIGQNIGQQVDSSVRVLEALAGQVQAIGKLEPAVLQKIVTAQRGSFPVFFSMYVGDGEGSSVATDPSFDKFGTPNAGTNYKDRDYYQGIVQTRKPFIGPVRLGRRTHLPSVQIAVPVFDPQGRLRSYAAGAIDMNIISPQVEKIVSGLPGLSVVVMDPTGRVIIHPEKEAQEEMRDFSGIPFFREMSSPEGELRSGADDEGRLVRGAAVSIPRRGMGWRVVTYRTDESIEARVAAARRPIWGSIGIGILSGFILAGLVFRWKRNGEGAEGEKRPPARTHGPADPNGTGA